MTSTFYQLLFSYELDNRERALLSAVHELTALLGAAPVLTRIRLCLWAGIRGKDVGIVIDDLVRKHCLSVEPAATGERFTLQPSGQWRTPEILTRGDRQRLLESIRATTAEATGQRNLELASEEPSLNRLLADLRSAADLPENRVAPEPFHPKIGGLKTWEKGPPENRASVSQYTVKNTDTVHSDNDIVNSVSGRVTLETALREERKPEPYPSDLPVFEQVRTFHGDHWDPKFEGFWRNFARHNPDVLGRLLGDARHRARKGGVDNRARWMMDEWKRWGRPGQWKTYGQRKPAPLNLSTPQPLNSSTV